MVQAPPSRDSAVFLDIDGTLLNLAATPDAVIIPGHLPLLLRRLSWRHGGALALISGRTLRDIDAMFGPALAVAAEHGAILRNAAGQLTETAAEDAALPALQVALRDVVAAHPGAYLEEKRFGLVIHWRGTPESASRLTALATAQAAAHPGLVLQPAHEALEIRVRGPGKAGALEEFLREPPFAGRLPVFVGDDLTDEPAIALATALGGRGLHVNRDFTGGPAAILAWLEAGLTLDDKTDA